MTEDVSVTYLSIGYIYIYIYTHTKESRCSVFQPFVTGFSGSRRVHLGTESPSPTLIPLRRSLPAQSNSVFHEVRLRALYHVALLQQINDFCYYYYYYHHHHHYYYSPTLQFAEDLGFPDNLPLFPMVFDDGLSESNVV